jgi:CMP-N-acetylneuraminic acid synthetase
MNLPKIIIPAREGSKGFPEKNRKLFKETAKIIPREFYDNTYVTSDDDEILSMAKNKRFVPYRRRDELSNDTASMKPVLIDVARSEGFLSEEIIIMLYLTYPERTWEDVQKAYSFYIESEVRSMLCKKKWKGTHPALCMFADGESRGKQLFKHNLYRRQDYPPIFEISHFIFIGHVGELQNLNLNLYNDDTIFYPIADPIDVDMEEDYGKYTGK